MTRKGGSEKREGGGRCGRQLEHIKWARARPRLVEGLWSGGGTKLAAGQLVSAARLGEEGALRVREARKMKGR